MHIYPLKWCGVNCKLTYDSVYRSHTFTNSGYHTLSVLCNVGASWINWHGNWSPFYTSKFVFYTSLVFNTVICGLDIYTQQNHVSCSNLMLRLQTVVQTLGGRPKLHIFRKLNARQMHYCCMIFANKSTTLRDRPRQRTEFKSRQFQGHKRVLLIVNEGLHKWFKLESIFLVLFLPFNIKFAA